MPLLPMVWSFLNTISIIAAGCQWNATAIGKHPMGEAQVKSFQGKPLCLRKGFDYQDRDLELHCL